MAGKLLSLLRTVGFVLAAVALSITAQHWRSPLFAGHCALVLALFSLVAGVSIVSGIWIWRSSGAKKTVFVYGIGLSVLLAALASASVLVLEARFQWMRYSVLNANPKQLAELGRHFIVGYRDLDQAKHLAALGAVGGFFITRHNVAGESAEEIRRELNSLRAQLPESGARHLWIATDQEGGGVSRLSPPLPYQPSLSAIVRKYPKPADRDEAVRAYARTQAAGLTSLGVNLNLAPVIDLDHHIVNPKDRHTRISERAIGSEPALVASVGRTYCETLIEHRVQCTLKHFPGIGRVYNDTHIQSAALSASAPELSESDWIPFRSIMTHEPAPFLMLSHVKLTDIDDKTPVSFSRPVINGLLRKSWEFEGILITDDFSMASVYDSDRGIGAATVEAINSGVDLVLISYDPDQYFRAMYAMLKAQASGRLNAPALDASDARLNRAVRRHVE